MDTEALRIELEAKKRLLSKLDAWTAEMRERRLTHQPRYQALLAWRLALAQAIKELEKHIRNS